RGIELDGRSDLYALGVIAFECLAGQVPFRADNGIAVVQMHLTEAPPTFEAIDSHLSVDADMEDFLRHLLEKDAAHRPDSARQAWQYATELQQHYLDSTGSHGSIDLGLIDPSVGDSAVRPPSGRLSSSRSSFNSSRRSRRFKTRRQSTDRGKIRLLMMLALFAALGAGGVAIYNYATAGPGCGNAILDPGEDCDDGNGIDTDVCTNQCRSNIAYLHGMAQGEQRFFLMGSKEPPRKGWIATIETPATPVLLDPFFLMRNEVTREAWAEFQKTSELFASRAKIKPKENLKSRPKHPMTDVTIREARAYCQWLGGDLPDESQWEYAARSGGKDQQYPWGNEEPTCRLAITGNHACSMGKPAPVCDRPLGNSEQGVCDLAGNVWEFVLSVFPSPSVQRSRPNSFRGSNPWIEAKELPYNKTFLHYEIQLNELPSAYAGKPGEGIGRDHWDLEVQELHRSGRSKDAQELVEVASFATDIGPAKMWPLDTKWQIIRGGGFWHTVEFFNRARSRYFVPSHHHEPNIGFRCAFRQAPPTVDARRASLNMSPRRGQRDVNP
ncbi:MAG: SUMF1/EgtB/PvdO family nonheme iron enzyme, partial [Myxococcota bacterium]|nr:SUMF1/EgtB/PvdO family nonheme iron enzyme [Myxococcota bacterium]